MESAIYGKNVKPEGKTPSIILCNPKYPQNVGSAVRAASCFGAKQVWWTGNRVRLDDKTKRLPREERMKSYKDVELKQFDKPFDHFKGCVPVAIELMPGSESLVTFEHPENAVYVFGPEDGSVDKVSKSFCHRFIHIPTYHCTNLAAAVYIVLYDRIFKQWMAGGKVSSLLEDRGYILDSPAGEDVWSMVKEGIGTMGG